jgi:ABC-type branched-subunit amino acid transport system ATPase component
MIMAGELPALRATEVSKDYGDRPALHPVSLVIGEHERVVLIGHNGSGKTTLLRISAGLLDASSGTVEIFGRPAGSQPARRQLAYLGDTPTFYEDLSVLEHLQYVAGLHGVEQWEPRGRELLERLGIAHRADDLPTRFSRGMRQKTAIALGLIRPFSLLIVDEPFVGLDEPGREALVGLMDDAHRAGATVIVATHDMSYAAGAPRVIALREGSVAYDGAPGDTDLHALVG